MLERAPDRQLEMVAVARLGQEIEGASFHRGDGGGHIAKRGGHDDEQIGLESVRLLEEREPVETRHFQIGHHYGKGPALQALESLWPILRANDLVTFLFEQEGHDFEKALVVVDKKDAFLFRFSHVTSRAVMTSLPGRNALCQLLDQARSLVAEQFRPEKAASPRRWCANRTLYHSLPTKKPLPGGFAAPLIRRNNI